MREFDHVPVTEVPGANTLYQAYVNHFEKLGHFYAVDYRAHEALAARAQEVAQRDYPRAQIAAILTEQNQRWGASAKTRQHCEALAEPHSLAVVTGQQVGLFGGPLLTLYKALTCVKLAETLSARWQRNVVPIFWLATDDDDLAEVNRATMLTRDNALLTLAADFGDLQRAPTSQVRLPQSITQCHQQLQEALPDSEFKNEVLQALAQTYGPGRTLADAFAQWLSHLTGEYGLVLLDPAAPGCKQLAIPIFSKEIAEDSPSTAATLDTNAALMHAGFSPQVSQRAGRYNLFFVDQQRHALEKHEGAIATTDGAQRAHKTEWLQRVQQSPGSFSPNVILRPILQDALLPTIAYVAGPAEIAYFAQLRGAYQALGVSMPAVFPRQMLSLVEKKTQHVFEKYGLRLQDFWQNPEQLLSGVAKRETSADLLAPVQVARETLTHSLSTLKAHAAGLDASLSAFLDKEQGKLLHQLENIEKKIVQASKKQNDTLQQQLEKNSNALYPHQHLQERELNLIPFLCKYGKALIQQIHDAMDLSNFQHQIVKL